MNWRQAFGAAVKLLRLIPIRMATPELRANHAILLRQLRSADRGFQLQNSVSF